MLAALVVGCEFRHRIAEARIVERSVDVLVTHQLRERKVSVSRCCRLLAQRGRQRGGDFLERVVAGIAFRYEIGKLNRKGLFAWRGGKLTNFHCQIFGHGGALVVGQRAQSLDLLGEGLLGGCLPGEKRKA
jgi:hypothetical protein